MANLWLKAEIKTEIKLQSVFLVEFSFSEIYNRSDLCLIQIQYAGKSLKLPLKRHFIKDSSPNNKAMVN